MVGNVPTRGKDTRHGLTKTRWTWLINTNSTASFMTILHAQTREGIDAGKSRPKERKDSMKISQKAIFPNLWWAIESYMHGLQPKEVPNNKLGKEHIVTKAKEMNDIMGSMKKWGFFVPPNIVSPLNLLPHVWFLRSQSSTNSCRFLKTRLCKILHYWGYIIPFTFL